MTLSIRGRNHDPQARKLRCHPLRSLHENPAQPVDFGEPAAGQDGQYGRILGEAQRGPRRRTIGDQRETVGQRVSDELRWDAVAGVDCGLHREQAQHAVGRSSDLFCAAFAPGPDRGADVVCGADAGLLQLPFEPQVEIRGIDANKNIGRILDEILRQLPTQLEQSRQVTQHLDITAHRQTLHGE